MIVKYLNLSLIILILGFLSACNPLGKKVGSISTNSDQSVNTNILGVPSSTLSTISFTPLTIAADGTSTASITVTLLDSIGNSVSGKVVSMSSSRGAIDTISAPNPITTDLMGQTTFTIKSSSVGQSTLTASIPASGITLYQVGYTLFYAALGIPSSTLSTMTFSPLTVAADGTSTASITITLQDVGANPVSGKVVALSSSRGATDTITGPTPAVTNGSGQTQFTIKSSTVGQANLSASVPASSINLNQAGYTLFYEPQGIPNSSLSTMTFSPLSVAADGTSTSTVTVTLSDVASTPLSGKAVTLTSSRGATDTIVGPTPALTNASGQSTFTIKSTTVGQPILTAAVPASSMTLSQLGYPVFTTPLGIPNANLSTLTFSPLSIAADGTSTSTVTVTILDAGGNAISGKAVTLTSSRGATDTILGPTPATTNSFGQTTFTLKSSTIGQATLTAAVPASSVTVNQLGYAVFYVPPTDPNSSLSNVTILPVSVAADGVSVSTIKVSLIDSAGNPVIGKAVSLSSSRGATDTIVGPTPALTNAFGQTTFTVKSLTGGDSVFTASVPASSTTINQTVPALFLAKTPIADFQARFAESGNTPGSNILMTSNWKNLASNSDLTNANLRSFLFTNTSGWIGDGTLNTSGVTGPYRLKFETNINTILNYVDLGYFYNSNTSLSFETWINSPILTSANYYAPNTFYTINNGTYVNNSGTTIFTTGLGLSGDTSGSSNFSTIINNSIGCNSNIYPSQSWFHLVGSYDGSTKILKIFVNGVEKCSLSLGTAMITPVGSYIIGRVINEVADFRIYNIGLTAADATKNFNSTVDRFLTLPAAPILSITPSNFSATLNWNALNPTPIGYKVERSTDNFNSVITNLTTINQYSIVTTTNDTTSTLSNTNYQYRIQSYNALGASPYSNIVSFTTANTTNCFYNVNNNFKYDTASAIYVGTWNGTIIYNSPIVPPGSAQYLPFQLKSSIATGYDVFYEYSICKQF